MTGYLLDKSVIAHGAQARNTAIRARLMAVLGDGSAHFSDLTVMEMRWSARSPGEDQEYARLFFDRGRVVPTTSTDVAAADLTQRRLLATGHHRGPSLPDLLVAAVAERTGLVVLHVDEDFETIAAVTGQQVERAGTPAP